MTTYSLELGILDLDGFSWELLLGEEEDECPDNTYSILAFPDDPAASIIDNHPINTDPSSFTALNEAKNWVKICTHQHENCLPPSTDFMPTRLIQILRRGAEVSCRLVETGLGELSSYAALSYCWGGDQAFKTTLETLAKYKVEIRPEALPQGLQDAIFVAAQLDLEYIWIDALCIIQDSIEDKSVEIGQMAKVYGNATVTIAATRSSAVWNGFLGERKPLGMELPDMATDPLDTRAWTFQERVLSDRVLDFGSFRTQWSCRTNLGTAYGSFDLDSKVISDLISAKYDGKSMLQFWMRITEGFTDRALSFSSDKLPAIAGMADRFGSIMGSKYLAGLWRPGMPASLMWSSAKPETRPPRDQVLAPSWSWAAIVGPVRFDRQYTDGDKSVQYEVQILDCQVKLSDERSPYGAVSSGELTIRTHVQRARWVREGRHSNVDVLLASDEGIPLHPEAIDLGFKGGESSGISVIPDALETEFLDDPKSGIDVCLALCGRIAASEGSGLYSALFGLVLRPEFGNRYSRVGLFKKTLAPADFVNYADWFHKHGQEIFLVI
ncbi:HET-domain-containing protein [Melanomma pulvis-pyrius CBS 109.77]|uniref:HET-domain-containing protein n=1 Tax=Melanomma pulvis-pyrius CBS 109.77 TaxID=1314802 RepID=A0A6A6XAJ8_9PLEO|nr:HET-domain-containing protein [Melanomma pulvis-pyrius CBS 109.77]